MTGLDRVTADSPFRYANPHWTNSGDDCGFDSDLSELVEQAINRGRYGYGTIGSFFKLEGDEWVSVDVSQVIRDIDRAKAAETASTPRWLVWVFGPHQSTPVQWTAKHTRAEAEAYASTIPSALHPAVTNGATPKRPT